MTKEHLNLFASLYANSLNLLLLLFETEFQTHDSLVKTSKVLGFQACTTIPVYT
jgi:hypothetical protein